MDILAWLWWVISTVFGFAFALVWFLVSGWVSALLQIALLVIVVYFLKYGWQRAPAEIWRRTRSFAGFFLGWIRARDAVPAPQEAAPRLVKAKEFGDINISTLLSLLMFAGLLLASRLEGLAR
ncbi:MAG TPA: hypothetical protein VFR19_14870 [Hyphomicrobiaceae bacterium]|jgi:hypothetical protein|nr:hypothetical protein [Hyphomicrobiaceae bacterium]